MRSESTHNGGRFLAGLSIERVRPADSLCGAMDTFPVSDYLRLSNFCPSDFLRLPQTPSDSLRLPQTSSDFLRLNTRLNGGIFSNVLEKEKHSQWWPIFCRFEHRTGKASRQSVRCNGYIPCLRLSQTLKLLSLRLPQTPSDSLRLPQTPLNSLKLNTRLNGGISFNVLEKEKHSLRARSSCTNTHTHTHTHTHTYTHIHTHRERERESMN